MTAYAHRLPFSLNRLMAEANRRTRQRRSLVAAASAVIIAGIVVAVLVLTHGGHQPQRIYYMHQ